MSGLSDPPRSLLLTGGSSSLGWAVAVRLARRGIGIHLLVRKAGRRALRERVSALRLSEPAAADLLRIVVGDLSTPDVVHDPDARERLVTDCAGVVHLAGAGRGPASREDAFDLRVGGLRSVLELARSMGEGSRTLVASALDVAGDYQGVLFEADLFVAQRFPARSWGETRLFAERHARAAMRCQSVTVVRVPPTDRLPRWSDVIALHGRVHVMPAGWLGDFIVAAVHDPRCVGQTLHAADPFAMTARAWVRRAASLGRAPAWNDPGAVHTLPLLRARFDTTAADALLRRAGLERPTAAKTLARIAGAGDAERLCGR